MEKPCKFCSKVFISKIDIFSKHQVHCSVKCARLYCAREHNLAVERYKKLKVAKNAIRITQTISV